MGDYLTKRLRGLGFAVSEDDAGRSMGGNCGNLYAVLEGSLPGEPLLFSAHMDTVEPSRGKRAVLHKDGTITSDGSTVLGADDCAALVALLKALETIRGQGLAHRTLELVISVAEEIYCGGISLFDFSRLRARECYVLDLTGPVGTAAYAAPSLVTFEAVITGRSAHAGFNPEDGAHAIAAAAEAVAGMRMGRVDADTTFNVGVIEGGRAGNIVPDRCVVRGEARSFSHERALTELERARDTLARAAVHWGASLEFSTSVCCEAYAVPFDHPVVKRFERACEAVGLPCALERTFGGSDNNHFAEYGITGIVLATAMMRCHSCEEYTSAEELGRIAALTAALMTSAE